MMNVKRDSVQHQFRAFLSAALPILLSISVPLMGWKALTIITGSPSPVMCVISESMAPAFHRGDVLFLWNRYSQIHAGDIPVVWFSGNPLPMVHRAVQVYNVNTSQFFVTKGDNNEVMDVPLYPPGQEFVSRDEVVGIVRGYVPLLGWLVIGLQEVVWVKWLIFAVIFCLSICSYLT